MKNVRTWSEKRVWDFIPRHRTVPTSAATFIFPSHRHCMTRGNRFDGTSSRHRVLPRPDQSYGVCPCEWFRDEAWLFRSLCTYVNNFRILFENKLIFFFFDQFTIDSVLRFVFAVVVVSASVIMAAILYLVFGPILRSVYRFVRRWIFRTPSPANVKVTVSEHNTRCCFWGYITRVRSRGNPGQNFALMFCRELIS